MFQISRSKYERRISKKWYLVTTHFTGFPRRVLIFVEQPEEGNNLGGGADFAKNDAGLCLVTNGARLVCSRVKEYVSGKSISNTAFPFFDFFSSTCYFFYFWRSNRPKMIKTLTLEEAKKLRERVLERFRQSPDNGAGLKITSYKNKYKPLAEHIAQAVPDSVASVTVTRLCKFFYDTNPDLRPPDKLLEPSFGDDFVRALRQYACPDIPPAPPLPPPMPRFHWRILPMVALLLCVAAFFLRTQFMPPPTRWEEKFDSVHPDSLRARGWKIMDYDSVAFARQIREGCLTAYTYPGGYWVKKDSGEIPMLKNMVVKPIGLKKCVITTRLVGSFHPQQDWQGAGVFLFGPDLSLDNNLSVFFAYCDEFINGDSIERFQKIQIVLLVDGKARDQGWFVRKLKPLDKPIKEIEFELEVREKTVAIGWRTEAVWRAANLEYPIVELPFVPAYVGVGAAQGHSDGLGRPLGADTIPAFFEFVKVDPLRK